MTERIWCEDHDSNVRSGLPDGAGGAVRREIERSGFHSECNLVIYVEGAPMPTREHVVEDDFGRRTVFTGDLLLEETSDNSRGNKPQWIEVDVWRTEAGSFVVRRTTRYRIRHVWEDCHRADGYDLSPATPEDTYECPNCTGKGLVQGSWRQDDRVTVDAYNTPHDLILGFQNDGKYSNLARTILAEISDRDDRVNDAWNTVVVP